MPSVNLSSETYEKLKDYAARKGRTPDAAAEELLSGLSEDEFQRRWEALLSRTRARVPEATPLERIETDVAEAIREARAESRAGGH